MCFFNKWKRALRYHRLQLHVDSPLANRWKPDGITDNRKEFRARYKQWLDASRTSCVVAHDNLYKLSADSRKTRKEL